MTALVAIWALAAAGFTGYTLAVLRRRRPPGRDAPARGAAPAVLILRPVDEPTPAEIESLGTPVAWAGGLEQVVLSPRPLAVPGVRWVASDPETPNRKVGHLLRGLDVLETGDRTVLAIDADVRIDAPLVDALVAAVHDGAALATAAPCPDPAAGLGARAARALLCHTQLSFVALDAVSVGPKAICGKAMALSPVAREGLRALRDHVGEDLELARWLHRRGLPVVLAGTPARVAQAPHSPFAPVRDRFTRWMQVLRAHRPGLWWTVPLLFTPSLPLLVFGAMLGGPALTSVLLLWAVRTALAYRLEPAGAFAWPLGECVLLLAFARALGLRTLTWRGRRFRLERGGRMTPVTP